MILNKSINFSVIAFSIYITTAVATYLTEMLGTLMFSSRSSMWDGAYVSIIPCYFLPSLLGHSFLQARKPAEPIFVSPKKAFQERR